MANKYKKINEKRMKKAEELLNDGNQEKWENGELGRDMSHARVVDRAITDPIIKRKNEDIFTFFHNSPLRDVDIEFDRSIEPGFEDEDKWDNRELGADEKYARKLSRERADKIYQSLQILMEKYEAPLTAENLKKFEKWEKNNKK